MLAVLLDINSYNESLTLILLEVGKYFVLLVFSVLAIRLWWRWNSMKDAAGLGCALAFTILAVVIGYYSMRQSLGSLYSYYGMKAFHEGRLSQALTLFETAERNWSTADATGQMGVCLLLSGNEAAGRALIAKARTKRKGNSQFEDFYEGVFLFAKEDVRGAIPLLESAGRNDEYRWSVVKIFAVINLEAGQGAEAARLMGPFMQAEVTEPDQAYIMASLKLADGKKNEARALLDKFPPASLPSLWQGRYQKLRAQLQD